MAEGIEHVAYETSVRAIELQNQALTNLRTRAGTLLAASSLVASFLGAPALRDHSASLGVAVAIVALLGVLGLTLAILWPYTFTFRLSANVILEDHVERRQTEPPALLAFLARKMEEHHDKNECRIGRLMVYFQVASALLVLETIALLTAV